MFHAKIILDRDYQISKIDDRIYSSFLEHLGRAVYGGVYEPGHINADENGFRKDVIDLVRDLRISTVRYPGGNFVSGFNWEDSVGPKSERPSQLDLAWFTTESNEFGLHEFMDWCDKTGIQPMMCVNLGTRGPAEAKNLIEYTNHPANSYWSNKRIANGRKDPMGIKLWCLGNEMDGPWQIGHKTAYEYGRIALETAKVMKWVDPSIELIVCGSSGRENETYAEWERVVLEECYDTVDYLSLHQYYKLTDAGVESFLAQSMELDDFISEVVSICDCVKAKKRSKKQINLSFDEWNVWYHSKENDKKMKAGQRRWENALPLCEDIYDFKDALLNASMLMSLIRHADRVKIACIAQLVNVIAPIMTRTGGGCWKQTIYYPFLHLSKYGRGTVLQIKVDSPQYDCINHDGVPYMDAIAVMQDNGEVVVFCVNRNLTENALLKIDMRSFGSMKTVEHIVLHSDDLDAFNSEENPYCVCPESCNDIVFEDGYAQVRINYASWNVIRFAPVQKDGK